MENPPMMPSLEFWSLLVAIISAVIGLLGILPLYSKRKKKPEGNAKDDLDFSLLRFQERSDKPVDSDWSIRILHPNKRIEKCTVLYDRIKLPWWDKSTNPDYEKYIGAMSGGNVRIPKRIEKPDALVVVKDGDVVIKRKRFSDLPLVNV